MIYRAIAAERWHLKAPEGTIPQSPPDRRRRPPSTQALEPVGSSQVETVVMRSGLEDAERTAVLRSSTGKKKAAPGGVGRVGRGPGWTK